MEDYSDASAANDGESVDVYEEGAGFESRSVQFQEERNVSHFLDKSGL